MKESVKEVRSKTRRKEVKLRIIHIEEEVYSFEYGPYIAYGEYDDEGYGCLVHAPTEKDLDTIASILDDITSQELAKLLAQARGEGSS